MSRAERSVLKFLLALHRALFPESGADNMILKSKNYKALADVLTRVSDRERALIEQDPIVLERRRILLAAEGLKDPESSPHER